MIIAHRGAAGYAPENTLPALRMAIELGATHLEVDVHQTRDKHVVAIHDYSVDRTTNGSGDVSEMTLAELKELDAGSWFGEAFAGTRIPTLVEVLEIVPDSITLIIELKGSEKKYPGFIESIIDTIKQRALGKQIILKSFNTGQLLLCQKLAPEIPRLYVFVLHASWLNFTIGTFPSFSDILENIPADARYYQAHRWFLRQNFVEKVQAKGIKLIAWHVNTADEIEAVLNMGVDGIETDYPDRVRRQLQKDKPTGAKQ